MKRVVRCIGISRYRSYSVYEVTRALRVTPQTVRRWIKQGLPALTDKRPFLILGIDLIEFLEQRKPERQRCELAECYCVKCHAPQKCAEGMAEYIPITPNSGNLRAHCPNCATLMHKRVAHAALTALSQLLDISIADA